MAQYKVKKEYIHYVCTQALSEILEQQEQIKKSKKWYHWWFRPLKTNMEVDLYKWRDICFCEEHINACIISEGNFVFMDETELYKIQKFWKEYCYDLKK